MLSRFFLCLLVLLTACRGSDALTGSWQLQAYGPVSTPFLAQAEARLAFDDGQVSGNAGCNSLGGQYHIVGSRLFFSQLSTTLIACLDPVAMQQESQLLDGLNNASSFTVQGDRLLIYYDNGKQALVFQRIP